MFSCTEIITSCIDSEQQLLNDDIIAVILSYLENTYSILNYSDIFNNNIITKYTSLFDLDLSNSTISNLSPIKGILKVKLHNCRNIKDSDLQYLQNANTLDLSNTNVSRKGIKYLSNVHTLNLSQTNITDGALQYLTKCHTLNISQCLKLTNKCLKYLSKCHTINLSKTNITDDNLSYLSKCDTVNIYKCLKISHIGLLKLITCKNIKIDMFSYLASYARENLMKYHNISICREVIDHNR